MNQSLEKLVCYLKTNAHYINYILYITAVLEDVFNFHFAVEMSCMKLLYQALRSLKLNPIVYQNL